MCRPRDTVERSMKVGHFVLRLMSFQGGSDNSKDHCAASKWHTEAHFQTGGISRPSPCWFCFPLCFHTRFQLQIFFPEPVDKGWGNKVPPTLSDEQVPSNPSPSMIPLSPWTSTSKSNTVAFNTHTQRFPQIWNVYIITQSKLRTGGCTWIWGVNTSVNTLTFSTKGKCENKGILYQEFRISMPGLPNSHLHYEW